MHELSNSIGNGTTYINVYNNGNLGLPICANVPYSNIDKVVLVYGNCPNHTIQFSDFKYTMTWVIR